MSINKKYYLFQSEPKDTSCERCLINGGKIFEEEELPLLPIHPNCGCKATLLDYEQLPEILFNNIKEGEYFLNDDFLPQKKGRYWMKITISPEQKIYYSNDDLVITTKNNGRIYRHVQLTKEIHELLYSLPMVFYKNILDYNNKPVNENKNIAKPDRSDDEFLYFIMDDGKELKVNMDTLNGMGILPNGNVIIGYGKENPQYYYDLLVLRERYRIAKEANVNDELNNIKLEEYNKNKIIKKQNYDESNELYSIRKEAYDIIKKQNPDEPIENINKRFLDGWLNIPDDYYQIYDVTNEINNIMNDYYNSKYWQNFNESDLKKLLMLLPFILEVKTNGKIDLKNNPNWYHPLYIYDDEIIDVDALGNILFGFLGALLDYSEDLSLFGASIAQSLSEKRLVEDDSRDVERWIQGREIFINN